MPANTRLHRYFDAFDGSYDAVMDAVQSGVERGYRLSSIVLAEVERGQHEMLELGRTFATEPTDIRGMYSRVRESAGHSRARGRELGRQVIDELAQSRTEARETFDRIAAQQRVAEDATIELARDLFNRIIDRAEARLPRIVERSEAERPAEVAAQSPDGARGDTADLGSVTEAERSKALAPGAAKEPAPKWMTSSPAAAAPSEQAPPPAKPRSVPRADAVRDSAR